MNPFFRASHTLLVSAALLGPLTAAAQQEPIIRDSLSLEGTVRSVLDANPGVTQLDELLNQADERVSQSRTGFLPQVTGTATYTRLDPVAEITLPGADGKPSTFSFVPHNNYDAHITAQYLLYDFGANKARLGLAQSQRLTAANNIQQAKRDLAYSAVQTYYAILLLRESVSVADEQIAGLQAHQREMEKRIQGGVATKFDVSQTKVRIAQAQNQKIDLQNQQRQQEIQLARLLHRQGSDVPPVRGRLNYASLNPDVTALVQQGLDKRIEMKQARDARQIADAQIKLADAAGKPTLGIGAQAGFKNGYVPDIQQIRPNWAGVVQLSVPIYDGNKAHHQRAEARAGARAAEARVLDTEEQVRADVQGAVAELQSQAARYDNSQVQIEAAADALNRSQLRQKAEVGTNLDVLDAQTALAQAKLARLQAVYGYLMGQYRLKRAVGDEIQ